MPAQTREIKGRLQSIRNTKKITKAMELVSGAKMRKAVQATLASRFYAKLAWELAQRLSVSGVISPSDYLSHFFRSNGNGEGKGAILIVFTANRGLAGAFNSNVVKKAAQFVRERGKEQVDVICVGRKGVTSLASHGIKPVQAYEKDEAALSPKSIVTVANYVYQQFKQGHVGQVWIAYTNFRSPLVQEAVIEQLFPFASEMQLGKVEGKAEEAGASPLKQGVTDYFYEPGRRRAISYLVPRLAEARIYQALLESNASEHSARMVAMKNATEAAGEMYADLLLEYNRARQASITQEVAEITAGTAAVS